MLAGGQKESENNTVNIFTNDEIASMFPNNRAGPLTSKVAEFISLRNNIMLFPTNNGLTRALDQLDPAQLSPVKERFARQINQLRIWVQGDNSYSFEKCNRGITDFFTWIAMEDLFKEFGLEAIPTDATIAYSSTKAFGQIPGVIVGKKSPENASFDPYFGINIITGFEGLYSKPKDYNHKFLQIPIAVMHLQDLFSIKDHKLVDPIQDDFRQFNFPRFMEYLAEQSRMDYGSDPQNDIIAFTRFKLLHILSRTTEAITHSIKSNNPSDLPKNPIAMEKYKRLKPLLDEMNKRVQQLREIRKSRIAGKPQEV